MPWIKPSPTNSQVAELIKNNFPKTTDDRPGLRNDSWDGASILERYPLLLERSGLIAPQGAKPSAIEARRFDASGGPNQQPLTPPAATNTAFGSKTENEAAINRPLKATDPDYVGIKKMTAPQDPTDWKNSYGFNNGYAYSKIKVDPQTPASPSEKVNAAVAEALNGWERTGDDQKFDTSSPLIKTGVNLSGDFESVRIATSISIKPDPVNAGPIVARQQYIQKQDI